MTVHVLLPAGVDDPLRPSGGNLYDRRVVDGLRGLGLPVREHLVGPGGGTLARTLGGLPEGATVLVDGLVGASDLALVAEAGRLRLVLLLHMATARPEVLRAVAQVVTTSRWTRRWVVEQGVPEERVHVAVPGADPGPPATCTSGGQHLLCVGPTTAAKGHDVLVAALDRVADLDWHCTWVGAHDRDAPRGGRITYTGPLPPTAVDELRSTTDLVVSASRWEAYGMAVAEGLARGLPAVVTDVGGHPEVVGRGAALLVPPGDADALAAGLRRWLTDPGLRARLRAGAAERRTRLATWADTVRDVAAVVNPAPLVSVSPSSGPRAGG